MNEEYFSLLIAGFDDIVENKLYDLLQQIKNEHPDLEFNIQTTKQCEQITTALNNGFYKICLLNAALCEQEKNKIIEEIQANLTVQNKHTAIIILNTEPHTTHSLNHRCNRIELDLIQLNSYWLYKIIMNELQHISLQKEIKRLSHYDNLTGLVNRNLYLTHLNHALALADLQNNFCTLIYIDINNFKNINKQFGIKYGDLVLIECANRIKKSIRTIDLAARLGSDEFAILLENCQPQEKERIIDDLKQAMSMVFNINLTKINVEFSINSASYPDNYDDVASFLKDVRQAHYMAKTN